ncbi:MAG: hypothetical protein K0R13_1714 [Propionibacteriaceae bacterium]|nr:hypothetical protein [Propionibacteriaceae bacterium]
MPSPVGTRHRRLAAAAAPVGLYSGFSASRDSAAANRSNTLVKWRFWMCLFAAGWHE